MMNAILRKENSAKLHRRVLEPSKKIAEGKTDQAAIPPGRTLFDVAVTMCTLFHYPLMEGVPPANPARSVAPPVSKTRHPENLGATSTPLGEPNKQ